MKIKSLLAATALIGTLAGAAQAGDWGIRLGMSYDQQDYENDALDGGIGQWDATLQYNWSGGTYFVMDAFWTGNADIAGDSFTFRFGREFGPLSIGGLAGTWMKTDDVATFYGVEAGLSLGNFSAKGNVSTWSFIDDTTALNYQIRGQYDITDALSVYADFARIDREDGLFVAISPLAGVSYDITDRLTLDLHYGQYTQKYKNNEVDHTRMGLGLSYSFGGVKPDALIMRTPPIFYK